MVRRPLAYPRGFRFDPRLVHVFFKFFVDLIFCSSSIDCCRRLTDDLFTCYCRPPEPKLGASSVHSGGTADTRTTHRRTFTSIDDILLVYFFLSHNLFLVK